MPNAPIASLPTADLQHAVSLLDPSLWEALRGQRLFVTGGTGFLGTWLLATLIEADREHGLGYEVLVLSRDPAAFAARSPDLASARGIRLLKGDVRDFTPPKGRFKFVIHAATDVVATSTPLNTFDTCVGGTRHALDFAIGADATDFLLVSSGAVYGTQPPGLERLPENHAGAPDPLAPASAYGQGKRASEWLVNAYASEHGLRTVIARCFAFVGPHLPLDKQFAIGNFIRDAMAQRPILVRGDGTPYRTYLHAADMAGWLWKILFSGTASAAYNVGGTEAVSIGELARRVSRVLGSQAPVTLSESVVPGLPAQRYVPDVRKAQIELSLGSNSLPLDEAIRRTAEWHSALITPKNE